MADNLVQGEWEWTDANNEAIFGSAPNYSALPATTLSGQAQGPQDWGQVLTNGIAGAAVRAINGMVQGANGQLASTGAPAVTISQDKAPSLMIIAVIAFLLLS
jgi:hypothetical protein